jgi:hypothetical protein
MTDQSLPPPHNFTEMKSTAGIFDAGHVFNQTVSIFSRNVLPFGIVTAVAYLPSVLTFSDGSNPAVLAKVGAGGIAVGVILTLVLNVLSQAVVLYGAFEDMRGLPVNLGESIKVGLRRFFPVLGVSICVPLLAGLAAIALVFPGLMVGTMLFVSVPVCVVERLGVFKSMGRSARLTKGHRWKIFGIWIAVLVVGGIAQSFLTAIARTIGGMMLGLVISLVCGALVVAFNAILAVVVYHDLRVAKEGVDTDQIASVFD